MISINSNELIDYAVSGAMKDGFNKADSRKLVRGEGRIDTTNPSHGKLRQLLPSLRARLQNATRNDIQIFGLSAIITELEFISDDVELIGYGISFSNANGTIYLLKENMKILGMVLVETR